MAAERLPDKEFNIEDEPWFQWRLDELVRAGYPPDYAYPLAGMRVEVDLHKAIELIGKCGADMAFRILG